jgi:hypothetical protein
VDSEKSEIQRETAASLKSMLFLQVIRVVTKLLRF